MLVASAHHARLCLRDPDSCLAVVWARGLDKVEVRRSEHPNELGPLLGVHHFTPGLPASAALRQLRRILRAHERIAGTPAE